MSIYSIQPVTFGAVRTYPLASRKSKVSVRDFAKPPGANSSLTKFLDSLPNILAAEDLRELLSAIHVARKQRKPVLWGIGGHVIKVGLGAVLIDLMRHGFVSGIAMNGAALIHDFEIALAGNTSEDVEAAWAMANSAWLPKLASTSTKSQSYPSAFELAMVKRQDNIFRAGSSMSNTLIAACSLPLTSTASL